MQRTVSNSILTIVLILGLAGCATGPGKNLKLEGSYIGSLTGSPNASLRVEVSGNNISGTGTIIESTPIIWRGKGDPPHINITGVRHNQAIQSMSATVALERNTTPLDTFATWIDESGQLNFTGEFNNSGAIVGSFGGQSLTGLSLGGAWRAVKEGAATGILKPR